MTNDEKARELAKQNTREYLPQNPGFSMDECEKSALEMAEWKDQQFKEYLEKKKIYYENKAEEMNYYDMPTKEEREIYKSISYAINEIINELSSRTNMDLGTLVKSLRSIGDQFTSYYGIETNIESVELFESTDGKYQVKLKTKENWP